MLRPPSLSSPWWTEQQVVKRDTSIITTSCPSVYIRNTLTMFLKHREGYKQFNQLFKIGLVTDITTAPQEGEKDKWKKESNNERNKEWKKASMNTVPLPVPDSHPILSLSLMCVCCLSLCIIFPSVTQLYTECRLKCCCRLMNEAVSESKKMVDEREDMSKSIRLSFRPINGKRGCIIGSGGRILAESIKTTESM